MTKIKDLKPRVRSKNAEPFYTTLDLFMPSKESYEALKESGSITVEAIADTYNVPTNAVYGIFFVDAIDVVKITIYKYSKGKFRGSGDPAITDLFGAQQQMPIFEMEVDVDPAIAAAAQEAAKQGGNAKLP